MKSTTLLILALSIYTVSCIERSSYARPEHEPSHVKNPTPKKSRDELPTEWFWNNVDGVNYVTLVRNHHIPNYCGGCYAFASTSALSDRIKIARNAQWPDILLSPQVLLSCSANRGCHGGSPSVSYQYIKDYGITDESCSNYLARGHENGAPCTDEIKCSVCDSEGNCEVPESYPIYTVEEYGTVSGEKEMLNEIYHRGPIACSIDADFIEEYTEGIVDATAPEYVFNHIVDVIGYGEEGGVPFWFVKNSWGSFWGMDGYFKVQRGINSIGIETTCGWAVPKDTWTEGVRNYTKKARNQKHNDFIDALTNPESGCVKVDSTLDRYLDSSFTGELPHLAIQTNDLPASWDWRNVEGVNYVSWTKSENSLGYCASCWVEAITSVLADRIMVARQSTFPEIALSVQAVINCQGGGDCSGGDPIAAVEFAYNHGIPEDSCQNYQAKNPESFDCSVQQICKNCDPPAPYANGTDPAVCVGIKKYNNWRVSNYGTISGVENMKKAILSGGPISCGIQITGKFQDYEGGVFTQWALTAAPNHQVAVVGWGVEDGTEYWIVRNSWGTYWGELGFAKVQTGGNNLGLEKECIWVTPIIDKDLISVTISE